MQIYDNLKIASGEYDVLEVYSGHQVSDDFRIAQLCNANKPPNLPMLVTSSSSFMTVRFKTGASM